LSDAFAIENVLKQGNTLSPLRLNFALEYVVLKVTDESDEEFGGIANHLLVCANDSSRGLLDYDSV
jgi:hypothetical protein